MTRALLLVTPLLALAACNASPTAPGLSSTTISASRGADDKPGDDRGGKKAQPGDDRGAREAQPGDDHGKRGAGHH